MCVRVGVAYTAAVKAKKLRFVIASLNFACSSNNAISNIVNYPLLCRRLSKSAKDDSK